MLQPDLVVQLPGSRPQSVMDWVEDQAGEQLAKFVEGYANGDVPVRTRIESGDAHEVIHRLCETESWDLIVMGTHGRTAVSRLLLGSVAEKVVRTVDTPVLTIKLPEEPARKMAPGTFDATRAHEGL